MAAATGVSRRAIHAGLKELESRQTDERAIGSRIRRHGAGRKRVTETDTTLQANKKTLEGTSHPDRNAQFEYINAHVADRVAKGEPVISVDTKKKELIGRFKNNGQTWCSREEPTEVKVHDCIEEAGRANPYGVYDR